MAWVQISDLLFSSHVALNKLLDLSDLQFLYVYRNEIQGIIYILWVVLKIKLVIIQQKQSQFLGVVDAYNLCVCFNNIKYQSSSCETDCVLFVRAGVAHLLSLCLISLLVSQQPFTCDSVIIAKPLFVDGWQGYFSKQPREKLPLQNYHQLPQSLISEVLKLRTGTYFIYLV